MMDKKKENEKTGRPLSRSERFYAVHSILLSRLDKNKQ